jgi:hypothetical protein
MEASVLENALFLSINSTIFVVFFYVKVEAF